MVGRTYRRPIPFVHHPLFTEMKTPIPLFFITILCFSSNGESKSCNANYNCGELANIGHPFWGNERSQSCGRRGFELNCKDNKTTTIEINSTKFNVLNISQSDRIMRIARSDLFDDRCPSYEIGTASLEKSVFAYSWNDVNISVWYDCTLQREIVFDDFRFLCGMNGSVNYAVGDYEMEARNLSMRINGECKMKLEVTVTKRVLEGERNRTAMVEKALKEGFEVDYADFTHLPPPGKNDEWKKAVVGVCSGIGGIMIMSVAFFIWFCLHKKKLSQAYAPSSLLLRNSSNEPPAKELEGRENYMGVPLFSYEELEKATDRFNPAKELGDGGFGTVYYGKLQDGREVAVKRLFQNNYKQVEHFMNEVETLTRLRHPHLVALYGCTSRRCRELLLVYEFIPNGTVADHLHGNRAKPGELQWHTRLKIAIETASALAFLHASETIHRDVKTTNILLDSNFGVKVADFGLSRLFPSQATHVSTAPQGTPGYVDPEYHECYQLTNKSDVFSFGVVLVELISSKPAVDITRHRHEINLWTMAINKIRNDELHDFVDPSLGFETDGKVRDMICAVAELAFRCLQSVKDTRPCMLEALEILNNIESRSSGKGNTEGIDISRDVDVLLKGGLVPESPDSVVVPWMSKSSTSNGSD